ncbi:class I SAM-dependent methyltransferase [Pseudonocardia aurantiaca]
MDAGSLARNNLVYREPGLYDELRADSSVSDQLIEFVRGENCAVRTVLDLGCGTARILAQLHARCAWAGTGVDFQPDLLAWTRRRHPCLRLEAGDICTFDSEPRTTSSSASETRSRTCTPSPGSVRCSRPSRPTATRERRGRRWPSIRCMRARTSAEYFAVPVDPGRRCPCAGRNPRRAGGAVAARHDHREAADHLTRSGPSPRR